jgi:Ca2+-binding RTX toxin-like protein
MLRFIGVALLGSLAVIATPPDAEAGQIIGAGARLAYVDNPTLNASHMPEQNSLSITSDEAGNYVFNDAGAVITTGLNATGRCDYTTSSHIVKCRPASGDVIQVDTGGMDDEVQTSVPAETFICGGAGNDTITATGTQRTELLGGPGNDVLIGGEGPSGLFGDELCLGNVGEDPGDDVLIGNGGDDQLVGGPGNDLMQAGAGDDTMFGDPETGDQSVHGNDSLQGGAGDDLILGMGGNDALFGDEGADTLAGGAGDDRLYGGEGNDTLGATFALNESVISRESGNDFMQGGGGDDVLNGGPGEFVFNRGSLFHPVESEREASPNGSDTLLGGSGTDTVTYANRLPAVSIAIDNLANDGSVGEHDMVGQDVEAVTGGSGDDVLKAGALGVSLDGGPGNDVLIGGRGNDTLSGGTDDEGADTLTGGAGNDKLTGGGAEDRLRGSEGDDRIDGGSGSDYMDGGPGADELQGASGADILRSRSTGPDNDRCGRGLDLVILGKGTEVGGDCERIDRPGRRTSPSRARFTLRPVAGHPAFAPSLMFNSAPLIDTVRLPYESEVRLGARASAAIGVLAGRRRSSGATVSGDSFAVLDAGGGSEVDLRLTSAGLGAACSDRGPGLRLSTRGRFGVVGRRSKSIGRRATWVTQDRCNGTFTHVRSGKVVVDDFGRDHRVLLRAGHSYLARRR